MFVLMNESSDEIHSFVVTETGCMTVTHVRKSGLTKVTSCNAGVGMNLWSKLKNDGWVEIKKPRGN